MSDDDEGYICSCCQFEYPVGGVEKYTMRSKHNNGRLAWYCVLCSSTTASTAQDYLHPEASVLATICFVGNQIRKDLHDRKG